MFDFEDTKQKILNAVGTKARRMGFALMAIRVVLVCGGALMSAVASVFLPEFKWPLTDWQIVSLTGAGLVFLGGFSLAYTEDSPEVLRDAQLAINHAESVRNGYEEAIQFARGYEKAAKRLTALYVATSAARGVLEQAASSGFKDQRSVIVSCLTSMQRDLRLALGIKLDHTWTICVYLRESAGEGESDLLRCVAHDRTHHCDIGRARTWKEGVGVGGMALARNSEVVAPDIRAPQAGSLFSIDDESVRALDRDRYRSLIGVPVQVGDDEKPIGVVVITSDQPEHFGSDEVEGVAPEEGARALAGVVALAVALCRANEANTKV